MECSFWQILFSDFHNAYTDIVILYLDTKMGNSNFIRIAARSKFHSCYCAGKERARKFILELQGTISFFTRVLRNGEWKRIKSSELVKGDIIMIRLGNIVPADCIVLDGFLELNESSLTGESFLVEKNVNDLIYSGTLVDKGEAVCKISAVGPLTYSGKTIELLFNPQRKVSSSFDKIIGIVTLYLLGIIFILMLICLILIMNTGMAGDIQDHFIPLFLLMVTGTIPLGLPAMFAISTALEGISLSKKGVLITNLNALEEAANMSVLFFGNY
jgi:H+-transporting ATPase